MTLVSLALRRPISVLTMVVAFGTMHETIQVDIPAALRQAKDRGCPIDLKDAVYFGARDTVVCSKRRSRLVRASLRLFTLMFRNSVRAVDLFNLPPNNFVEVGRQIEI